MSYCVNCGVELDDSAKKCALCSTPVINPNLPAKEENTAPFSPQAHIPSQIKVRFIAGLVSLIMLIPNIVCVLINALWFNESVWSVYIFATSFLAWVVFVVPFFMKKNRSYFMWGFDTAAIALYVYVFFAVQHGAGWYYNCALPIVLFNSFLVLIYMIWVKTKKRHSILKALFIFSDIAVSSLVSGLILSVAGGVKYTAEIGIIIFLCIVAVIVFLTACYCSKSLRRWMSKRFFI